MASLTLTIFLLLLTTFAATVTATLNATTTNNFIKSKCSATSYPTMCVQSLSNYANRIRKSPRQLAQTASIVSLAKAHHAKTYLVQLSQTNALRPKEVAVLKDCMEEICDTVDQLSKSAHEFQKAVRAGSRDFRGHMSNVQTWSSAALTDTSTCIDESKRLNLRIRHGIKAKFKGVMQCTSNALALVNQFAYKYTP